jgi:hypothetical protein
MLVDASLAGKNDLAFQARTHENVIRMSFQDWFLAGATTRRVVHQAGTRCRAGFLFRLEKRSAGGMARFGGGNRRGSEA